MMKNFKKVTAMVSCMLVLASGMTAMNGNAILSIMSGDKYQEKVEQYNNTTNYDSYPELCETIGELFNLSFDPNAKVTNVWLMNTTNSTLDRYVIDYAVHDRLDMSVDVFDTEVVTEEMLKQEIIDIVGSPDMISGIGCVVKMDFDVELQQLFETSSYRVGIQFSTENHDENFQKCKEITSLLKEKYDVTEADAQIENHEFYQGTFNHIFTFGDVNTEECLSEAEAQEMNESFAENNFNVHLVQRTWLGKEYYGTSDEDIINMTIPEKYEFALFMYRNYGQYLSCYVETSGTNPQTIDLLNIAGDADCDNKVNINDAVLVMQAIANPDKYSMTMQGIANADVVGDGDGVTLSDAMAIQDIAASHAFD